MQSLPNPGEENPGGKDPCDEDPLWDVKIYIRFFIVFSVVFLILVTLGVRWWVTCIISFSPTLLLYLIIELYCGGTE